MLTSLFISVDNWMTAGSLYAAVGSFAWGVISVLFSPCHLASIPLIVAYVAGQEISVKPKKAGWFAGAFTLGLFVTIALIGLICTWMGRMLGDVGIWWQVLVGGVLIWVALGMLGVKACSLSGSLLYKLNIRGVYGAFALGLAYGGLSGSCTFGFIAPILAIVTVQQEVMTGMILILLFASGHCLPIMIAGCSSAWVRKLTEKHSWQGAGFWFRKGAGAVIALLGAYFVLNPFMAAV